MTDQTHVNGVERVDLTALPLFTQSLPAQSLPGQFTGQVGAAPRDDAPSPNGMAVDWSLVAALRAQASEQLSQAVAAERGRLDRAAQEELGRSIVLDLIESGIRFDDLKLDEPVKAVHQISHDPTLKKQVALANGKKYTPIPLGGTW